MKDKTAFERTLERTMGKMTIAQRVAEDDKATPCNSELLCAHPRDKTGRQIEVGDTLKVFHFTGSRRKKYFMYKYVEAEEQRDGWERPMLRVSMLHPNSDSYFMAMDGKQHMSIEIVQGFGADGISYEDRPRT